MAVTKNLLNIGDAQVTGKVTASNLTVNDTITTSKIISSTTGDTSVDGFHFEYSSNAQPWTTSFTNSTSGIILEHNNGECGGVRISKMYGVQVYSPGDGGKFFSVSDEDSINTELFLIGNTGGNTETDINTYNTKIGGSGKYVYIGVGSTYSANGGIINIGGFGTTSSTSCTSLNSSFVNIGTNNYADINVGQTGSTFTIKNGTDFKVYSSIGSSTVKVPAIFANNIGTSTDPVSNVYATSLGATNSKVRNVYATNIGTSSYRSTSVYTSYAYSTNGFFQDSDINKKNIKGEISLERAYDLVDKCQEILYTLKDDKSNKEQIGMIAQEVKEFFPEIVSGEEGNYSLDYARLTVVILRVLKDVINRVKKLESK